MKDTVRKGSITETKAMLRFLELGYNVFLPFGDGSKCDIIIQDISGGLFKIQCKTSRYNKKSEVFNAYSTARTRSSEGTKAKVLYTKKEVDFFCTFDSEDNMYLIPIELIKVKEARLKIFKDYVL